MIAEQLQAARAAHWRQNHSPILTLDEAQSWFAQHPLCLYLPRTVQLPAPAPSFVEACLGSREATPGAEALRQAQSLLIRLVESGAVVPLNLFGTVSEQPDFLAHKDALPFVVSLRADADWKVAPKKSSGHAVSPLVLELWKTIEKEGSVTAAEARQSLGRELTEAAVLRGLCELWQGLRISPVLAENDQPARWEMMRVRHRAALTTGAATGQVTAISLLVSMYLQSVYAATGEQIEIFLSPVSSRSRVREAVRGLSATRQIHSLSMDAQTFYFLEGGLPEFAEVPAAPPASPVQERTRPLPAPRVHQTTRMAARGPADESGVAPRPGFVPARPPANPRRPEADRSGWRPVAKPYARKAESGSGKEGARSSADRPKRPPFAAKRFSAPREERPGRTTPAGAPTGGKPPFRPAPRPGGAKPERGGPPRPYARPGGDKPERSGPPRPYVRPGGAKPERGGPPRPYARPGGDKPERSGPSRPYARPGGAKPERSGPPRPYARPGGAKPERSGPSRPYARPGGAKPERSGPPRPYARPGGAKPERSGPPRPYARSGGAKPERSGPSRPYARPGGAKPERSGPPRPYARPGGAKPERSGPPRPYARPGGARPERGGSPRPAGAGVRPPGAGTRPPFASKGRTGGGSDRKPGNADGRPKMPFRGGKPPGKAGFSRSGPRTAGPSRPGQRPPARPRDRKPDRKKPDA